MNENIEREKKLDVIGWGLFFVWVGIASLAGIGWGPAVLVTGLIILGVQAARRALAFGVEAFWVAVGALFTLGGLWQWFDVRVALVPILLLLAGVALLGSTLIHRRAH